MKKHSLLIVMVLLITSSIQAQNPVLNLSNYLRNGMLERAYENLNIAMQDDRLTGEARTWQLRGNLYYNVYRCHSFVREIETGMTDSMVRIVIGDPRTDFKRRRVPEGRANLWEWDLGFTVLFIEGKVLSYTEPANGFYKQITPNAEEALRLAMESYLKALELDPRLTVDLTFPVNPIQGLAIIADGYTNLAAAFYNKQEWESAFLNFLIAHQLKENLGIRHPTDTIAGHYAVRAAGFLVRELSEAGKYEEALEVVAISKTIDPDQVDLALSEADTHLKMRNFIKTKELLEAIITKQPDNQQLYFIIGNIYETLSKDTTNTKEENEENLALAIRYYKEALEIDPEYFDALFNLGTVYNNVAVDLVLFASTLRYPDPRFDQVIQDANTNFRRALPYLEKAHNNNPLDPDPIRMLYAIYLRLNMNDEAKEMRALLEQFRKE
jgi:tetratricopeptide (TPR) repeat protein